MRSVVVAFVLLIGVSANTSFACENWVAKVVSTNGLVEIKEGSQSKSAEIDSVVCPGQVISVAANSRAALYLSNNSFVRLDQNTVLAFPKAPSDHGFWVQLQQGVSHFISRITQRFIVDAPYVNAAVDGTEFLVSAQGKESSVSVIEGQVTASNEGGQQVLTMGQKAVATGKASGFRLTPIQTEDVIDWAIYYSPLPVLQELQASDSAPVYQELIEQAQQQRPDLALQALQKQTITESLRVADAALLMSVGQAEKALAQIESSTSTQALALKSVIFSSRNQSEKALDYAQKAVQQDSQSSAALLALSYAHQAALNLPEALQAAHRATLLEENNAIAWARVSEMELAMGNIRQADKAIAHAQQKQPDSAYVITQAGFIKLFNIRIDSAKALFKQAIALDSENPQAHLGLGLALLRQGELKQGREQLEYATSLDPARSVVRSYLGRAYFEEKRDEEAGTQWALAKQLDPNDPTPYFYEGVRKLYANDPIGAIEELETSRKLNDERALYRSETLLQSDAASRSATLARAYDDVGYDQGVLLSGWDALKNDPTSSEGHRLLADYYRGNSRYETARASELLQSQLWQPLSAYPLQPQLSETGISVVEGSGPQNPGFNEYHSLFTQDGVYGSVTGYGGSDGTWGDDLVGSFLAGPVAVSLGQYHFETDGWRDNSDQEQDIYNGFVQWQINANTSIQIERRKFEWFHEDIGQGLRLFLAGITERELLREVSRIGLTHKVSEELDMIVNIADQELSEDFEIDGLNRTVDAGYDDKTGDVQFIYRGDFYNIVMGGAYTDQDQVEFGTEYIEGPDPGLPGFTNVFDASDLFTRSAKESSAYIYFDGQNRRAITWGVAAAYIDVEQENGFDRNQRFDIIDPFGNVFFAFPLEPISSEGKERFKEVLVKTGLSFDFEEDYVFRLAVFETLARSFIGGMTLEPTQFMGFNQVFDDSVLDAVGSFARNYAVGLDFQSPKFKYSISGQFREIDAPLYFVSEGAFREFNFDQIITDANLMLFPVPDLALSAKFIYEKYIQREFSDGAAFFGKQKLDQITIPLSVRLFSGSGISVFADQIYYNQRFHDNDSFEYMKSSWVTSVGLNYYFSSVGGFFEIGVLNLLDEDEEFSSVNGNSLEFYPARFSYVSLNLNL